MIRSPWSGKAAALNAAMEVATGEISVFTDARRPLDRFVLRNLLAPFADPAVGAVSAEPNILQGEAQEEADIALYYTYDLVAHMAEPDRFRTVRHRPAVPHAEKPASRTSAL